MKRYYEVIFCRSIAWPVLIPGSGKHKLQCRESMSESTVEEYFQVIKSGKELPPLRCVDVSGELHLVDGFTRYAALTRASKTRVDVAVSVGTMEDAKDWRELQKLGSPSWQSENK
jgi:hypothetical protein